MPVIEAMKSVMTVVIDAATPWYFSSLTMSMATDLMMRFPPTSVPSDMASEHRIMSHSGNSVAPLVCMSNASAMPKRPMDMNFWPSCAPCRKESAHAQTSWRTTQTLLALLRFAWAKKNSMILVLIQPSAKPARSEKSMPYMTSIHSLTTTPANPFMAMAPPVTPAMSEWDLDAGMPRYQQKKPHPMEPIIAAMRAMSAWCVLPEKLTMLNMVWATAVEM